MRKAKSLTCAALAGVATATLPAGAACVSSVGQRANDTTRRAIDAGGRGRQRAAVLGRRLTVRHVVVKVNDVLYHRVEPWASYKLVLLGVHTHAVADILCR